MSDYVYKQMIDKVTNLPIQGGTFFLRDVENVKADVSMTELPDDGSGSTQGRYVSDTEVEAGVWAIYRVVAAVDTPTGDEVHVEPARVTHGAESGVPLTPVASRLIASKVYVNAFLPDDQPDDANPSSTFITDALSYAAANNIPTVVVGAYKDRSTWTANTAVVIPAGIKELDLAGADINVTSGSVIEYEGSTPLLIKNGTLTGGGASTLAHVVTSGPIVFQNVAFVGLTQILAEGYTCRNAVASPADSIIYIGCSGARVNSGRVYVPTSAGGGGLFGNGNQISLGGTDNIDPKFGAFLGLGINNIAHSSVLGNELDEFMWTLRKLADSTPVDTSYFQSFASAAKALLILWFTDRPLARSIYDSNDVPSSFVHKAVGLVRTTPVELTYEDPNYTLFSNWKFIINETGYLPYYDVADAGVDSGYVARIYGPRSGSTWEKMSIESFSAIDPDALTLSADVSCWGPGKIELDLTALTAQYPDILVGVKNISVKAEVFIPRLLDDTKLFPKRTFSGGGAVVGSKIECRFLSTYTPEEMNFSWFPGGYLNLYQTNVELLTLGEWVPDVAFSQNDGVYLKLTVEFTNPALTAYPRFK